MQDLNREEDKTKADMGSKTWADLAGEMKVFLWNPEERTCLGRTAKSWGRSLLMLHVRGLLPFLLTAGGLACEHPC